MKPGWYSFVSITETSLICVGSKMPIGNSIKFLMFKGGVCRGINPVSEFSAYSSANYFLNGKSLNIMSFYADPVCFCYCVKGVRLGGSCRSLKPLLTDGCIKRFNHRFFNPCVLVHTVSFHPSISWEVVFVKVGIIPLFPSALVLRWEFK